MSFLKQTFCVVCVSVAFGLIVYYTWYTSSFSMVSGVIQYMKQQVIGNTSAQNISFSMSLISQNNHTLRNKINYLRNSLKNNSQNFHDIQLRRLYDKSSFQNLPRGVLETKDVLNSQMKNQNPIKVHSRLRSKTQDILKNNANFLSKRQDILKNDASLRIINQRLMEDNFDMQKTTQYLKNSPFSRRKIIEVRQHLKNKLKLNHVNGINIIRQQPIGSGFTKTIDKQTNRNFSYICPRFVGRLGNSLFQYASTYGIGASKGMRTAISAKDEIAEFFDVPLLPDEDSKICLYAKPLYNQEPKMCSFFERVYKFSNKSDVAVKSENYLQSWKYFKNVESDIRKNLKFKSSLKTTATSRLKKVTEQKYGQVPDDLVFIGVHIRRGDYLDTNRILTGYLVGTKEYILLALTLFRNLFERRLFLVFTENITESMDWSKKHIVGDDIVFMFENERTAASDLCLLSMCNHTIMTVGTYGWWGAWIANGLTVYAKDFATPGSHLRSHFSSDGLDYYLPKWIGL